MRMAETAHIITSLESQNESFNLGANFDNVYLNDENDFSLLDLYNHYNSFLTANLFTAYGKVEPTAQNINVWYDTTEEQL